MAKERSTATGGRTPTEAAESRLLSKILEIAPEAIVTIDEDGTVTGFSPRAERMFGHAAGEVIGRNVDCLMPEPWRARHDGFIRHYIETGERKVIGRGREVEALRADGQTFVAELTVGEILDGNRRSFVGFIRDVGDRVAAVKRANRLQRDIDRVSRIRAMGELSTALAHEINQPLAAIANFASAAARTLGKETPDIDRARAQLEQVAAEARRAGEILRRMRLFVERGRIEVRPEDINEIVSETARLAEATSRYEGFVLDLELADDLPPVLADRVQIQQVILNLLRNAQDAIGATHAGHVHIETAMVPRRGAIRVQARPLNEMEVAVIVADDGPGIDEEMALSMFAPFTSGNDGVGVGLAICRTIVESHGGRIWAVNREGGGAEVHFTLPIAREV